MAVAGTTSGNYGYTLGRVVGLVPIKPAIDLTRDSTIECKAPDMLSPCRAGRSTIPKANGSVAG